MKMSGIYKIQSNIKPKRVYIGSATNITGRWNHHLSNLRKNKHHSIKLQRHFDKYGKDDLQFSILICCDKENLIANEQFFIDAYNPYFNCATKAGSRLGMKISEESRERYRKASAGRQNCLGYKHTQEFCIKSSENRKKNWQDPEYAKKVSDGLKRSHQERGKDNASILALKENLSKAHTPRAMAKRIASYKKTIKNPDSKFYQRINSDEFKLQSREQMKKMQLVDKSEWYNGEKLKEIGRVNIIKAREARLADLKENPDKYMKIYLNSLKHIKRNMGNHNRWHKGIPYEECPICNKVKIKEFDLITIN